MDVRHQNIYTDDTCQSGMRKMSLDETIAYDEGSARNYFLAINFYEGSGALWYRRRVLIEQRFEVHLKAVLQKAEVIESSKEQTLEGFTIVISGNKNRLSTAASAYMRLTTASIFSFKSVTMIAQMMTVKQSLLENKVIKNLIYNYYEKKWKAIDNAVIVYRNDKTWRITALDLGRITALDLADSTGTLISKYKTYPTNFDATKIKVEFYSEHDRSMNVGDFYAKIIKMEKNQIYILKDPLLIIL